MEELIKEAESLYQQIDKIQLDLVKSRLDVCEERKWKTISEMAAAMCAVFQFLKYIIDRKDNIVDIGEVWHSVNEEPEYGNPIVYITKQNNIGTLKRVDKNRFTWYIEKYAIYKWAYLKDLLPKGGD